MFDAIIRERLGDIAKQLKRIADAQERQVAQMDEMKPTPFDEQLAAVRDMITT